MTALTLGHWAEQNAWHYLLAQGCQPVRQNYHSPYGEIDLIVQHQDCLVFVEVKARAYGAQVSAIESISASKQKKFIKTALYFLAHFPEFEHLFCRIDVICFDFKEKYSKKSPQNFDNLRYELQWIENAFTFDAEFINL